MMAAEHVFAVSCPHMKDSVSARRFLSVDALRGITVAFMILVNDPGDGRHLYAPLEHAEWNGWTLTDLVFPNFLFLVGCAVVFSVNGRLRRGVTHTALALQVLRRAVLIFAIKTFLSLYPHFQYTHMRIFGVLTRIAVCYAIAAWIYIFTRRWQAIAGIAVALLVTYWALLRFVPVPGFGMPGISIPFLDPDGNLTSWIDRGFNAWTQHWLHTGSLYRGTRDPEGVLSTLPSIATTLLGMLAGLLLVREPAPRARRSLVLAACGLACFGLAEIWNVSFPINKNLWTSSYVLLAAAWSLAGLALFHWLLDEEQWHERHAWIRNLVWPFLVFGSNAIFAYALSSLLVETLASISVHTAAGMSNLRQAAYFQVFARHGSTPNTSLAFAISYVLVCFVPTWLLWRRRWFLRV